MKTKTLSELKSEARDKFSFILISCPNWSSLLKQISTEKVFNDMIALINAISDQTKSDEAKQWLRVCLQEVRESWKNYEAGNLSEGRKLIQRAREHFQNAFSRKPIAPRFTAGESGAALDNESGFPD